MVNTLDGHLLLSFHCPIQTEMEMNSRFPLAGSNWVVVQWPLDTVTSFWLELHSSSPTAAALSILGYPRNMAVHAEVVFLPILYSTCILKFVFAFPKMLNISFNILADIYLIISQKI